MKQGCAWRTQTQTLNSEPLNLDYEPWSLKAIALIEATQEKDTSQTPPGAKSSNFPRGLLYLDPPPNLKYALNTGP